MRARLGCKSCSSRSSPTTFSSVQGQAYEVQAAESADEQAVTPRREQVAGVEHHAARRDYRIPVVERLFHAGLLLNAARDGTTLVLDAIRDRRPSVVLAFARDVELIAAASAVLNLPQLTRRRMHRGGLHVAMTERPDFRPDASLADERIVFGDRAIGIDADNLADAAVHLLSLHAPLGDRAVALRDEQGAVAPEVEASAEMQRRDERRRLVIDHLHVLDARRRRIIHEPAARDRGVIGFAVFRLGKAPVNQVVLRKCGIERDVEQATLAARVHRWESRDRLRQRAVGAHHSQSPRPFGHQHLAARKKRETPWVLQAFGDCDHGEGHVELLLRRTCLARERWFLPLAVRGPLIHAVLGAATRHALSGPCWRRRRLLRSECRRHAEQNCDRDQLSHPSSKVRQVVVR